MTSDKREPGPGEEIIEYAHGYEATFVHHWDPPPPMRAQTGNRLLSLEPRLMSLRLVDDQGRVLFHIASPEDTPIASRPTSADPQQVQSQAAHLVAQGHRIVGLIEHLIYNYGPTQEELGGGDWVEAAGEPLAELAQILGMTVPQQYDNSDWQFAEPDEDAETQHHADERGLDGDSPTPMEEVP